MPILQRRFRCAGARRGLGLVEVLVVLAIVCVVGLLILASLPRQRETARLAQCRANLMHIGFALALYEQRAGHLPGVPPLAGPEKTVRPSPLGAMLEELGFNSFVDLKKGKNPPPGKRGTTDLERPVPGFVCPSDPRATSALFSAPVTYRACTGDRPDGQNGVFAPGKTLRVAEVEAADGLAYTAVFAERLVGSGQNEPGMRNYSLVAGPVGPQSCKTPPLSAWRGDAGSSWLGAAWTSTLYNHSLTPNATPSCVAADGQTALMGASSGHADLVHVLILDGSVRPFTTRGNSRIWRALANFNDVATEAPQP
jgi:prepilin-type N-terminal cleavage/methylation domain-containing protein